ncbi:MAG TPA: hypothetical protein VFL49_02020, partial [Pseudolabrys sp.]|nr:hypothetical protein [Pseudolabrys sp.]
MQEIDNIGRRTCLDRAQATVLTAEEYKRMSALGLTFMHFDHTPDEDFVVAAVVAVVGFALER